MSWNFGGGRPPNVAMQPALHCYLVPSLPTLTSSSMKRKREAGEIESTSIPKPAPGTVVYSTGKAVKAGLAGGSKHGSFPLRFPRKRYTQLSLQLSSPSPNRSSRRTQSYPCRLTARLW